MEREIIVKQSIDGNGYITGYELGEQITRCRDCIYMELNFEGVPECRLLKRVTYAYLGYCSWGERKEENG